MILNKIYVPVSQFDIGDVVQVRSHNNRIGNIIVKHLHITYTDDRIVYQYTYDVEYHAFDIDSIGEYDSNINQDNLKRIY